MENRITHETKIEKSAYNGWNAETLIPMGFKIHDGNAFLLISTSKRQLGGLGSYAIVYGVNEEQHSRTTEICGDFRKHFNFTPAKIVNEKRVREAHNVALQSADAVMAEAMAFYKKKGM